MDITSSEKGMMESSDFESRYRGRFGVVAGYLPPEIKHIGGWLSEQIEAAYKSRELQGDDYVLLPPINALATLLNNNPTLLPQVETMIAEGRVIHEKYEPNAAYRIKTVMDMLITLNFIIITAPVYAPEVSHYAFPISGLFVYMMATESGWIVFKDNDFNEALRAILAAWCDYLDSLQSLNVIVTKWDPEEKKGGWLSPPSAKANNLDQFVTQAQKDADPLHWGFTSYNDYFHRQIIDICRPLDGPGNPAVIVSANDGTVYRIARNVQRDTNFEIKSQPYSLSNMLDNTFVDKFVHGDVMQTFLSGHDYHRWRAPISGTVVCIKKVPGYLFSELPIATTQKFDKGAGVLSQGYDANVNTRALIFIESPDPKIGMVCVMPIGITEISSIEFNDKINEGCSVDKGQELGWFSYGGSSLCLFFQSGTIKQFTTVNPDPDVDPNNGPYVRVKAQIAIANTSLKKLGPAGY